MIVLLRHAESYNNDINCNTYTTNADLTKRGVLQANSLIDELNHSFDLVIVSPSSRTMSTVQPLIMLNAIPVEISDIGEFEYLNFGICNKEYRYKQKKLFWENPDSSYKVNNQSESFDGLLNRANMFIKELIMRRSMNILVCSHKYFISVIIWTLLHNNDNLLRNKSMFYDFCKLYGLKPAEYIIIQGNLL